MRKWEAAVIAGCMAIMVTGSTVQACGGYDFVLNDIRSENGGSCSYAMYDLNKDGTEELIVLSGTCEADYQYLFYTIRDDGSVFYLGSVPGGHSCLYESENGIYVVAGQMGWEDITEVFMECFYNPVLYIKGIEQNESVTEYYWNDHPIELMSW